MDKFLQRSRGSSSQLLISLGNEAGDLDSLVSAIAAAFWYSTENQNTLVLPVATFPRRDFKLRGDAIALFTNAGFKMKDGTPEHMTFWDEIGDVKQVDGLILTDHNTLTQASKNVFGPYVEVVGIMDHHADKGELFKNAKFRIVDETCGSCCSIVASKLLENESLELPVDLVQLLLGVILLDTRNFDVKSKKFNDVDLRAHRGLTLKYPLVITLSYEAMMTARTDVSHLGVDDLLRLDFKSAEISSGCFAGCTIGFSSIMCSLPSFLERAGSVNELETSVHTCMLECLSVDVLVCLCKSHKDKKTKHKGVIVVSKDHHFVDAIKLIVSSAPANLLSSQLLENELFKLQDINTHGFRVGSCSIESLSPNSCYFTVSDAISRKTLMPFVLELLHNGRL